MNPVLQQRLIRVARIVDRAKRWERLAFLDEKEADRFLLEYELRNPEEEEDKEAGMDDGSYPAGPRSDKNKSRYKLEPGHGQDLSSLLRSTASTKVLHSLRALIKKHDE